ncbi:MAG: hypothetical protein KDC38_05925 [Planctomycetes bacterium]|nr:hypothetical protein [Planctomycetota bacterium]
MGLLVLLCGFGCSTPVKLDGSPGDRGLLVLDVRVERELILDMPIAHPIASGSVIETDRVEQRVPGQLHDGLLLFSVPPGHYRPVRLSTRGTFRSNWDSYDYVFRRRDLPEGLDDIAIAAGDVIVLSRVTVREASGFSGISTTIEWDPQAGDERGILEELEEALESPEWKRVIARRIEELDTEPDRGAAASDADAAKDEVTGSRRERGSAS